MAHPRIATGLFVPPQPPLKRFEVRDVLLERLAGAAVVELHLAALFKARLFELFANFSLSRARKRRTDCLIVKRVGSQPQMQFENLAKVHAAWHTQRV